ncbi:response regulator, partial [bacterium]|nr:response regulator [bacterium]
MIRLLIVDDSKTIQKFVAKALEPFSDIEIIDTAADPYDARKKIIAQKPDVITLDIEMPRMDGITFLKKIMQHYPLPVVIISSFIQTGSLLSIQALEMGAFEVIEKPENPEAFMQLGSNLAKTLRAAKHAHIQAMNLTVAKPGIKVIKTIASAKLLVMGGSTGGVEAFTYILRNFPASLLGTIIIQHMPDNFL